ncbi:hypothetical protein [Reinekea sp. G2M2-21]|uniref:DUF7167 family protein n=1 Tax=Reinekea sp. G2M2-21 TaxID=2788942 RepID=UPI0018A965C2|nr:hypothetical protein [Reinekea sp. G2M2-21]
MMATKNVFLHAVMNGDVNKVELDYTQEEWDALTEKQQRDVVAEYRDDVVELFVATTDDE